MSSRKKRRGRRTPPRAPAIIRAEASGEKRGGASALDPEVASPLAPKAAAGLKGKPGSAGEKTQDRQPPLPLSIARAMRSVGGSPVVLATSFLAVLALWLALSAYGVNLAAAPAAMAALESLPPVHSFLDLQSLASGGVESPLAAFLLGAFLLVFRAALQSSLVSLIIDLMMDGGSQTPTRRRAWRRALKSVPTMLAIEAVFLGLAVLTLFLLPGLLGRSLGQLGVLFALFGTMYLFLHAPVAAVAEGVGLREAVSMSIRAARLPGNRHVLFVFAYLAFVISLSLATPASPVAPATPTIPLWSYVLLASFLHVSALGVLTYRWLAVRQGLSEKAP